jgi:hypothetical protein
MPGVISASRSQPARCAVLGVALAACGGSTTGGSQQNTSGSCTVASGTYTEHYTAEPGGTNCPTIPDQTTQSAGGTISGVGGSGAAMDGGSGCTSSSDYATCTFSTSCSVTVSGFTTSIAFTYTIGSGSVISGKETIIDTEADSGAPLSSCTYDFTANKN